MSLLFAILLAQSGPASLSEPGYVTTGTQELGGFKYFYGGMCSMTDAYFNGVVRAYPDKALVLYGARRADDTTAAVVIANGIARDAGAALDVRRGPELSHRLLVVDSATGNVIAACEEGSATNRCSFVDGSGVSGHVSLDVMPRYYLTLQGRLGENTINTLADGGCDTMLPDGGCYAAFAALHGELTVTSSVARYTGGWGFVYINPVTDGTGPNRFFVDVWGGIGQRHNLIRAQFPSCPAPLELTAPQTQFYARGALVSTQLFAFDEERWHVCTSGGWVHADDRGACP